LKKLASIGLALVAVLAMAAVAVAQLPPPDMKVTGSGTPTKGGTPKKPKNAMVKTGFTIAAESKKTATSLTFYIPKNVKLSGKGFPSCATATIDQKGADKCPKGSEVGSGSATAVVDNPRMDIDFKVRVFNGGGNKITMFLTSDILSKALAGTISKAPAPYGQKVVVPIPPDVQQPIPGLYPSITGVTAILGPAKVTKTVTKKVKVKGKRVKKKVKQSYFFASLTGCPANKKHTFGARVDFGPNLNGDPDPATVSAQGTFPCKK
jgi:hypothetical protein